MKNYDYNLWYHCTSGKGKGKSKVRGKGRGNRKGKGKGKATLLEGVHKLFPTFSPAKPRNIFISEQKKPMKLKRRLEGI